MQISFMTGKEYELKIKTYFENKLSKEMDYKVQVNHLKKINNFEIDLSYILNIGGFDYFTIIECKNWNKTINQGMLTSLKGMMDEVKAHKGIMITALGFQSGAVKYASSHHIGLSVITKKMKETKFLNATGPEGEDILEIIKGNSNPIDKMPDEFDLVGLIAPSQNIYKYFEDQFGHETLTALLETATTGDLVTYLKQIDPNIKKAILNIPIFWKKHYLLSETDGLNLVLTNESEINKLASLITVSKFYFEKFKL
jgi:hypothetical protein